MVWGSPAPCPPTQGMCHPMTSVQAAEVGIAEWLWLRSHKGKQQVEHIAAKGQRKEGINPNIYWFISNPCP